MLKQSASSAILEQLAGEGRLVLSDWRAMVYLRRATFFLPPAQRRWSKMPSNRREVWPSLHRMEKRGELDSLKGLSHFYRASVPYARNQPLDQGEVLMEAHPYASLGYLSALSFHRLTEMMPKNLIVLASKDNKGGLLPADTNADDWEGIEKINGTRIPRVLGTPVRWRTVQPERYFGFDLYRQYGYPVRVTTPERTLIDGLIDPEASGGLENVLQAWALSASTLDVDSVVNNVEFLGERVLRQRVGFILERLGLDHPSLKEWSGDTVRGGSSKLLGSAPYSPTYDEHWDLSINAPIGPLQTDIFW